MMYSVYLNGMYDIYLYTCIILYILYICAYTPVTTSGVNAVDSSDVSTVLQISRYFWRKKSGAT